MRNLPGFSDFSLGESIIHLFFFSFPPFSRSTLRIQGEPARTVVIRPLNRALCFDTCCPSLPNFRHSAGCERRVGICI